MPPKVRSLVWPTFRTTFSLRRTRAFGSACVQADNQLAHAQPSCRGHGAIDQPAAWTLLLIAFPKHAYQDVVAVTALSVQCKALLASHERPHYLTLKKYRTAIPTMTRNDNLRKLHETLLRRQADLRRSLAEELSLFARDDDEDESHEDDAISRTAQAEDHELVAIDNALEKIQEGTYGQCESCERKIPLTRLEALPYATHCIDCQRDTE
jgi:DnaK suppressor protein